MRLLCFFFLLPALLPAQSGFLKDPDIVWAAEIEQDWIVDIPSLDVEWDYGVSTLKLLRTDQNVSDWMSPYLAGLVFQAAKAHKLSIFKDPLFKIPADPERLFTSIDTVVTFDPDTYEEKVQIVSNDLEPTHEFKAWRLRQILAYHRKTATWSATPEAIAALVVVKNTEGDSVGLAPLFWFRPDSKRQKITSSRIVWAKDVWSKRGNTYVSMDIRQPVKITPGFQSPILHLMKIMETDMKTPFYGTLDQQLLTPRERKSMLSRSDTIVTFDPETFEEKVQVVHNDINPDDIKTLRLYQTWYWDERRSRLSIRLNGVAPIRDIMDAMGNFRYSVPLFIRKSQK